MPVIGDLNLGSPESDAFRLAVLRRGLNQSGYSGARQPCLWEGSAEGHHKESGKYAKLPIVFFLDFDDQGKVREERVHVDVHLIGYQIK
jgi:hypothetical protein